jgi:septum formation protein
MSTPQFILASASPRRRELLTMAGYTFDVHAADIDESRIADETPVAYVQRLALEKASVIAALHPGAIVLGADTTVELDGEAFNKPRDRGDAEHMLLTLSGRTHHVHTAIALVDGVHSQQHIETTAVTFNPIDGPSLAHYLDTREPYDKAGAYGIQGYAARWIPRIDGDFYNVVGLPVATVAQMLSRVLWP